MAVNKNAQIRYNVIDKCLRNPGRKYFWGNLAEECGKVLSDFNGTDKETVSRRTILKDLDYMKSEAGFQAPIISIEDWPRKYYRYEDMSFSIRNQPLNEMELDQLKDAVQFLSRLSGVQEFDWIEDLLPKLQISVDDKISNNIISYQANLDLKNREFLGEIFNAIRYKTPLDLSYQSFDEDEPKKYLFQPHHLKQYNNRWFVFGEVSEWKTQGVHPLNFALDRITSIEISKEPYEENTTIDYAEYFDEIIGVTKYRDKKPIVVQFKVEANRKGYVETKPIHLSQKPLRLDESDGRYTSSINVIPNNEMYQTFFSFGDSIEILSPDFVVAEIKRQVDNLLIMYGNR